VVYRDDYLNDSVWRWGMNMGETLDGMLSKGAKLDEMQASLVRKIASEGIRAELIEHAWPVTFDLFSAGMAAFEAIQEGLIYARELNERDT